MSGMRRAVVATLVAAGLAGGAGCRQGPGETGAGAGSTGAAAGSTAAGVSPEQTGRSGPRADGGAPPAAAADAAAGDARTAASQLNPPDPGRPSANPEKGVTQPDPGFGNDHSSPKFGSATSR